MLGNLSPMIPKRSPQGRCDAQPGRRGESASRELSFATKASAPPATCKKRAGLRRCLVSIFKAELDLKEAERNQREREGLRE